MLFLCSLQYGFVRRKSTGSVSLDKTYGPGGRYLVGPDFEFKVFPADMHYVSRSGVAVFTSDRLEVLKMFIFITDTLYGIFKYFVTYKIIESP